MIIGFISWGPITPVIGLISFVPITFPHRISVRERAGEVSGERCTTFEGAQLLRVLHFCSKRIKSNVKQIKQNPETTFEGEQLLGRNVKQFQGGLVFKAHRLLYQSTLGSRVIKKKKK